MGPTLEEQHVKLPDDRNVNVYVWEFVGGAIRRFTIEPPITRYIRQDEAQVTTRDIDHILAATRTQLPDVTTILPLDPDGEIVVAHLAWDDDRDHDHGYIALPRPQLGEIYEAAALDSYLKELGERYKRVLMALTGADESDVMD
jgi:hypothetical protein